MQECETQEGLSSPWTTDTVSNPPRSGQETSWTYVCTVFQQQLGTAGVTLHTGSMQGGDPVQGAQVHTAALQPQRSHQWSRVKPESRDKHLDW